MTRSAQAALSTLAATALRLVVGAVFIIHGWQKYREGVPATVKWLETMAVPYPSLAAPVLIGVELLGGALLVLGLATRFVSLLLLAEMVAAFFLVHREAGFFAADGGYELVLLLAVVLAGFALTGAGRAGVDRFIGRRRGF